MQSFSSGQIRSFGLIGGELYVVPRIWWSAQNNVKPSTSSGLTVQSSRVDGQMTLIGRELPRRLFPNKLPEQTMNFSVLTENTIIKFSKVLTVSIDRSDAYDICECIELSFMSERVDMVEKPESFMMAAEQYLDR